ncbi:hypothetical protein LUZ63_008507 [Rhynchospora breviuscula]|uniref:FPL domain-containing protein n=1 Tax=Rhynchospora breviuscula TaxID=2022672 RepID=A0A9Q0CUB7_9POAL|nr:hypothetical protein LUZ63_008507 [Rhynchospora breviuscula]
MWQFWRARNRFSLDELRYLTDQLQKVQVVTEANKDFVIEALRSIAELVIYGDQHDPSFFEFFMEKQVMGEFARILRISRTPRVAFQLLQTMSIMIQNLKSENSIYYIFSNEHINYLITYPFDFQNDEMLSYYISFVRAISVKLNKNTISLLVKTQNEEVVSFPLYVEAVRFAFHEETMVRTAIRALTLNVYHVGDDTVNAFVSRPPLAEYFSEIVRHFQKQCINLDKLVTQFSSNSESADSTPEILAAVEEIEDSLYYFSDIMSSGVPELGRLITDSILRLLVFPLLLPSLESHACGKEMISIRTALYLLCCVLHIFKSRELASTVAATLFYPPECFSRKTLGEALETEMTNGCCSCSVEYQVGMEPSSEPLPNHTGKSNGASKITSREILLSYVRKGDDMQALGSLSLFATLLQTKELDESMLDGLGILPQRKQHKKLLLQALVGEESGEEQLFSRRLMTFTDLDSSLHKLEEQYGLSYERPENSVNPKLHRSQVLDSLVCLTCRSDVSSEVRWLGVWLLRQLLPHAGEEFTPSHLSQLKEAHRECTNSILEEVKGCWCDMLNSVIKDVWRRCKRAVEAPTPPKDSKSVLFPLPKKYPSGGELAMALGERMYEMVKIFVLQRQLVIFTLEENKSNQSPLSSPMHTDKHANPFSDTNVPKPGSEMDTANGIPCRIAFEKGKERHFQFLAVSKGIQGWIILLEEMPLKPQFGTVRVMAPLAGCNPRIDQQHPKWLHMRIRPSSLPFFDPARFEAFTRSDKSKVLVDGRWTLAFSNQELCKAANSMVTQEMNLQQREVELQLNKLLENEFACSL